MLVRLIEDESCTDSFDGIEAFGTMMLPINEIILKSIVEQALHRFELDQTMENLQWNLERESHKLRELNDWTITEFDFRSLCSDELNSEEKVGELTNADAGSICVVRYNNRNKPVELIFSYFQNDTLQQNLKWILRCRLVKEV